MMRRSSKQNNVASVECRACGSGMRPYLFTNDLNRRISDEQFRYSRCPACGLISLANVPDNLGDYYPAGYALIPSREAAIEAGLRHEQYKIDLLKQHIAGGTLLEIGPSWGAFCLLASRSGFSTNAIEMSMECCDFIRSRLGLNVTQSFDEIAALRGASCVDVIAMWHVIEHLRDPWALLVEAAGKLKPGGIIVLATPNPDALQARLFGRLWTHIDAPRHVHLIPIPLMRRKLAALGLEELLLTTRDEGSIAWNGFGWSFSLAGLARSPSLKRLLRLAGMVPGLLASPFERREGAGSAYTAIFRKPVATR